MDILTVAIIGAAAYKFRGELNIGGIFTYPKLKILELEDGTCLIRGKIELLQTQHYYDSQGDDWNDISYAMRDHRRFSDINAAKEYSQKIIEKIHGKRVVKTHKV